MIPHALQHIQEEEEEGLQSHHFAQEAPLAANLILSQSGCIRVP